MNAPVADHFYAEKKNAHFSLKNLNLSTRVLLLIFLSTSVLLATVLSIAAYLYSQDKITYIYDLQDLRTEKLGDALRRVLEKEVTVGERLKILEDRIARSPLQYGLPRAPELTEIFIGDDNGQPIIVTNRGGSLGAFRSANLTKALQGFENIQAANGGEVIYWLSGFGTLIASTHAIEPQREKLAARPAVSMFLRNNLIKGLITVLDNNRKVVAGFKEVPFTNTAVFIETPVSHALKPLKRFIALAVMVGILIIAFGLVLSYLIFTAMWKPIYSVESITNEISNGNYNIDVPYRHTDEIGRLFRFLERMAHGLKLRENKIIESQTQLRITEADKIKLETEIETAQAVQNRLIQKTETMEKIEGLEIAAACLPAEKCSGDWYGFHFDKDAKLLTAVLLDVTGHGVGSALMSGVAAGVTNAASQMLELLQYQVSDKLDSAARLRYLYASLDMTLAKFGHGEILASAMILCFDVTSQILSLVGAGHPPALLYNNETKKITPVLSKADILGLNNSARDIEIFSYQLKPYDALFVYTDGFTENLSQAQKFSLKRFAKELSAILQVTTDTADTMLASVLKNRGFIEDARLDDDTTAFLFRASPTAS